jgi:hypothetical protein
MVVCWVYIGALRSAECYNYDGSFEQDHRFHGVRGLRTFVILRL